MRKYYSYFNELGAKEIKRATLFYRHGAIEPVEYIGLVSSRADVRLPWMITENYRLDARSAQEVLNIPSVDRVRGR